MTTVGASSEDDAELALFSLRPTEDSGASTQSRFWFQVQVIARSCVLMLTRPEIVAVLCEWHEDFVEIYQDGSVVLVSCKHREPTQGPWSLLELCDDGGLAHLFDRWLACGGAARARMATNAGMKPGADNAAGLKLLCEHGAVPSTQDPIVEVLAEKFLALNRTGKFRLIPVVSKDGPRKPLVPQVPHPSRYVGEVAAFLGNLQFDAELPSRDHIEPVNINDLVVPALQKLQRDIRDARTCYGAITEIVAAACRDHDGRPADLARHLADLHRGTVQKAISATIARRTISPSMVHSALRVENYNPPLLSDGADNLPTAMGGHILAEKMRAGGVSTAGISAARRLREVWQMVWASRRTELPGDAATLCQLEINVLDIVDECIMQAERSGNHWGSELHRALKDKLRPENLHDRLTLSLNPKHLRGLAYDLCDRCEFWFSEPFPLSGEVL